MSSTLKTVAEEAGLSIPTVNQILNGHTERFAPKTCAAVLAAAEKTGYRPNLAARALRQKMSFLIGVLFSDSNATLFSDFVRGVMRGLAGADHSPIVFSSCSVKEESAALERCLGRRVDGLIVNSVVSEKGAENALRYGGLYKRGMPIVEVFGSFLPDVPKVNVDLYETARMAVDELVSAGHQTIALVTHDQYTVAGDSQVGIHCDARDQYDGYKQAITDVGSNPIVITQPLQTNGADAECFTRIGHDSIDEILSLSPHPTAVICYNDDIAWGVCEACRERSIDVPRELAVVGYGDDKSAHLASPPLTTFSRPVVDVAESATKLLLSRIEGKDVEDRILVPELILRRSTLSQN